MLTLCEEDIAKEWEKYKGFTVRPLPSTTSYYREIIQHKGRHNKFLLFGGTPEIRNIMQQCGFELVIIDRSPQVVRAMGRLTQSGMPVSENETLVEIDWLDLNLFDNRFDVLIGDDAINMVKWDHFDLFLENAARALNPGGIFLCHLLVKPDDLLINMTFSELMQDYQCGRIKSHYDLASRINFICYDKASYGMGWQDTITSIGKDTLEHIPGEFDFYQTFAVCNSRFYCPPQFEFESLVKKYFTIEEIFYPHEHEYCLYEPLYLLKKK